MTGDVLSGRSLLCVSSYGLQDSRDVEHVSGLRYWSVVNTI